MKKHLIMGIISWMVLYPLCNNGVIAQTDTSVHKTFEELGMEELLKIKIATSREQLLEEAPSIVSVITRKDMEAHGYRDIADALRMVPGFEYGIDVYSLIGLSFRGIWVHEGKVLIMLNGLTINDMAFGNYNFIGSLPVSCIERIEIIRGPGSAIYGGFAEVCVINIITTSDLKKSKLTLSSSGGTVGADSYATNSNISFTGYEKDIKYNLHAGYSDKAVSDREYSDFFSNNFKMNNETAFKKWHHIITDISYKGLSFVYQRTVMDFNAKDGGYIIVPTYMGRNQSENNHTNNGALLKYDFKLGSKLIITPQVEFQIGNSIAAAYSPLTLGTIYSTYGLQHMQKYKGSLIMQYNFGKWGQTILGGGYVRDMAFNTSVIGTPGLYSYSGDTVYEMYTEARNVLLQHIVKIKKVELTLGNRYENTSFGDAFAPRLGITYITKKFNSKLLYGNAYRIPTTWQAYSRELSFVLNKNLKAEVSNTLEFEVGYKLNRHLSAKLNTFAIRIHQPIVYLGLTNSYENFGTIESYGMEGEFNARYKTVNGFVNFSYNTPGKNTSDGLLSADKQHFLGLPDYKINAGLFYDVKHLVVGPTFTYLSERWGESSDYANGLVMDYENIKYDPILFVNFTITYKQLFKKVDISLSASNLLDQKYVLIQPYYGSHAPLPANDRQIMLGFKINL